MTMASRRILATAVRVVQFVRSLMTPGRFLAVTWIVAVLTVGITRMALADGLFGQPSYTDTQKTLFDAYEPFEYQLTILPDSNNSGGLGLKESMFQIVGIICNLLIWIPLGIFYGALTLLEWFLNLNIYQDGADQIDAAVQSVANTVFWPMIMATTAIGALVIYARWKGEAQGYLSDLLWMISAVLIAVGFVNQPSSVMAEVDHLRQSVGEQVIIGADGYQGANTSVTGYVNPTLSGPQREVAARTLATDLWDSFAVQPWCLAQFKSLDICKQAGSHMLANDDTWKGWEKTLRNDGQVPEFGENQDWIRGQDLGRLGYVVFADLMMLPMAVMLLILTFAGVAAAVGVLLMVLLAVLLLLTWPIPGFFRRLGTRTWTYLLGLELQVLFITVILASVMVVSQVIAKAFAAQGFYIIAILNTALFFAATKARSWLDSILGGGGGSSTGMLGSLAMFGATKAAGAVMSGAGKMLGGAASGAATGAGWAADKVHSRSRGAKPATATAGPAPRQVSAELSPGPSRTALPGSQTSSAAELPAAPSSPAATPLSSQPYSAGQISSRPHVPPALPPGKPTAGSDSPGRTFVSGPSDGATVATATTAPTGGRFAASSDAPASPPSFSESSSPGAPAARGDSGADGGRPISADSIEPDGVPSAASYTGSTARRETAGSDRASEQAVSGRPGPEPQAAPRVRTPDGGWTTLDQSTIVEGSTSGRHRPTSDAGRRGPRPLRVRHWSSERLDNGPKGAPRG